MLAAQRDGRADGAAPWGSETLRKGYTCRVAEQAESSSARSPGSGEVGADPFREPLPASKTTLPRSTVLWLATGDDADPAQPNARTGAVVASGETHVVVMPVTVGSGMSSAAVMEHAGARPTEEPLHCTRLIRMWTRSNAADGWVRNDYGRFRRRSIDRRLTRLREADDGHHFNRPLRPPISSASRRWWSPC
jgi:hypothetical protein